MNEDELLERLIDMGLSRRMSWDQVARCIRAIDGTEADLLIMLFGALFSKHELESIPQATKAGVTPWEMLQLHVTGVNCDGEDLQLLDAEELRRRMEVTAGLSLERSSEWLDKYAGLLVEESRRRKGVGRPA